MTDHHNQSTERVTRLAPSPTGALHLGNARTFLINWVMARQNGWRVVMRIEDLDGPRVKKGADQLAIEDLQWLGMGWDDGPIYQRADTQPYHNALDDLYRQKRIYPCGCSRKEIMKAASAPQEGVHEFRYSGKCRPGVDETGENLDKHPCDDAPETAWRLHVPDKIIAFKDAFAGEQTVDVQSQVGDFVVSTKEGLPSYQLAVVVDDARQGVTDIVRGDDLIDSTGRQMWIYQFLNLAPLPRYYHLPLVIGEDGRRLAKRHGDTRIAFYRESGVSAERVIGLLAYWSGIISDRSEMSIEEFIERFSLEQLPHDKIVFTSEDHAWLMEGV